MNSTELNQVPTVGTGPFLPVKWDKGARYQRKRNDDSCIYKVVPDGVQIANQLRTGEIDAGNPDKTQWGPAGHCRQHQPRCLRWTLVRLLHPEPRLDQDPPSRHLQRLEVRKALVTAIDRKKIAEKVHFGQADPADSSVSKAQWVHTTPKTQYPFDLAKAEKMLDADGWVKGADGIRAKGGVRMEWELRTNVGNKVRETLITVLADQWKQESHGSCSTSGSALYWWVPMRSRQGCCRAAWATRWSTGPRVEPGLRPPAQHDLPDRHGHLPGDRHLYPVGRAGSTSPGQQARPLLHRHVGRRGCHPGLLAGAASGSCSSR